MSITDKPVEVCIHGHFYQPPRENPWIEEIDPQVSAEPFHDWNERIHSECYLPNVASRIYDDNGKILDIVNNFEKISFNIGPTLMRWMKEKHPQTYKSIVEADKVSCKEFSGHGNAIAQVYNHAILPLADERDKRTQIQWGLADFESHFGRRAESIWLAETACDLATLKALKAEGIRFVILAPDQAQSIRVMGQEGWGDVSHGSIDPKKTYRSYLSEDKTEFIDIFFYDGPISKSVGFDDLLKDAKHWMHRLRQAAGSSHGLVSLATDGETFGHHKRHGDRALAYLTRVEIPKSGFRMTNFGEFLEKNPPTHEVRIKDGIDGLGTSWSCQHGIRRWMEHCGCRGDGPFEWTQHWRKPLRQSFDWLRERLNEIYFETLKDKVVDPWALRNDYIQVILHRTSKAVQTLLEKHFANTLSENEQVTVFKLLEMQRNALLMYTSCAWFFTDSSGIETIQNLRYSAKAIELAMEVSSINLQNEFIDRLKGVGCNHRYYSDGADIFTKEVIPSKIRAEQVVASHVISALFHEDQPMEGIFSLHSFDIQISGYRREVFGDIQLDVGKARWASKVTLEKKDIVFALLQIGKYDFRFSSMNVNEKTAFEIIEAKLFGDLSRIHMVDLMRRLDDVFGVDFYSLKDLPVKDRMKIIHSLTADAVEHASQAHSQIFEEHRRIIQVYKGLGLSMPEALRHSAEYALNERLLSLLGAYVIDSYSESKKKATLSVLRDAKELAIELNREKAGRFLEEVFLRCIRKFVEEPSDETLNACYEVLSMGEACAIHFDLRLSQEQLFKYLKTTHSAKVSVLLDSKVGFRQMKTVLAAMGFESEKFLTELFQNKPRVVV